MIPVDAFILVVGFLFGLTVGSFLNVVIWRLPREESIVFPGSHCPRCNAPIHWYDNLPLLSWIILGGRCRACHGEISLRYPLVEAMNGVFLALYLHHFPMAQAIAWYIFTAALIAVFFIDLDHKIIPNAISLPGLPLGLLANMYIFSSRWSEGLVSGALGILLGGGTLLLVAGGYYLITKREGMGMGDPKLLAMIGAFCGWQGVIFTMLISSMVGTVVGVAWIVLTGKDRRFEIPFGPFLALGAVSWVWFGPAAVRWYLGY